MTMLKKLAAVALCVAMLFSFASCRTENESALVYSDGEGNTVQVRSALYMLNALNAMSEYQSKYAEQTTTAAPETKTDVDGEQPTTTVNYADTKLEDKSYNEWVQEKAIESCNEYAYVEIEFKKAGLSFTDEDNSTVTQNVESFWQQGQSVYEYNGIAKTTVQLSVENSVKKDKLFKHIYGEGGSKAVPTDDVKKYLKENCQLVNYLSYSIQGNYDSTGNYVAPDESQLKEIKSVLEGFAAEINNGTDYATVRKEYFTKIGEQDSATPDKDAKNPYAMVMGKADSKVRPFEKYDDVAKLQVGKAGFFDTSSVYTVMQKLDINSDLDYLAKTNRDDVVLELKNDEFDKTVKEAGAKLTCDKNSGALNAYRADKLSLTGDQKK